MVLIAGLAAQLRCYEPERPIAEPRPRYLAATRLELTEAGVAARQRIAMSRAAQRGPPCRNNWSP